MSKTRANSFFPVWVRQRELRERLSIGHADSLYKNLYSSITPCHSWGGGGNFRSEHGGVFSLGFSPDGTLLVAGTENNNLLMFDPLYRRLISTVHNKHGHCISNVKFLNSRIFATGSKDETVCVWDTRNLKSGYGMYTAHFFAAESMEFSKKNDMLITCGVDGIIGLWNINNMDIINFRSLILRRLRLTSDESKMVTATASGDLLIVHDLDLKTFAEDFKELVLDLISHSRSLSHVVKSDEEISRLFSPNRRRNRLQLVSGFQEGPPDRVFPPGFPDREISALEVHPQGWSAFSRCTTKGNGRVWTCVNDIQERELSEGGTAPRGGSEDERPLWPQQDDAREANRELLECGISAPNAAIPLERGARERRTGAEAGAAWVRNPPSGPSSAPPHPPEVAGHWSNPSLSRPSSSDEQFNLKDLIMTHYIEEPDTSKPYIHSLGVSADGRLLCSPFKSGIRLLAFSPECSEQSVACGTRPRRLHELSTHFFHSNRVICTKFSPRHCLIVSGCSGGKVAWYQPVV